MLKPIRWIAGLAVLVWVLSTFLRPGMGVASLASHLRSDLSSLHNKVTAVLGPVLHVSAAPGTAAQWMNTTTSGAPVTWHACTIDYVLNVREAPGGRAVTPQVAHALALITKASGVHFIFQGYTNVVPTNEWASTGYKADPALAKDVYPPVDFGWAYRNQSDLFNSGPADAIAMTGPDFVPGPGGEHYVSGAGVIDASYAKTLTPGFGAGVTEGEVLVHEWEHIVGLGEGTNPQDLSYTEMIPRSRAALGTGDIAQLRALGGKCVS